MAFGESFKIGSSLSKSTNDLTKSFEKLSSGKRINKAQDDAAGLAIVSALEADVRTATQASRNALDGISITSIADDALGQISDITTRQTELAAQAANGTLSDEQRTSLDAEYQTLEQEKGRILETTTFNGVSVFEGTSLQVGSDSSSNSQVSIASVSTSSILSSQSLGSAESARTALDSLQNQTDLISKTRGEIGASASRIDIAKNNADSKALESESAAGRIRDVNVAEETANNVSAQIRQQVNFALAGQATKLDGAIVSKLLQ